MGGHRRPKLPEGLCNLVVLGKPLNRFLLGVNGTILSQNFSGCFETKDVDAFLRARPALPVALIGRLRFVRGRFDTVHHTVHRGVQCVQATCLSEHLKGLRVQAAGCAVRFT